MTNKNITMRDPIGDITNDIEASEDKTMSYTIDTMQGVKTLVCTLQEDFDALQDNKKNIAESEGNVEEAQEIEKQTSWFKKLWN